MQNTPLRIQAASSIPSSHSYTLDGDDDSDICPVCDGECICHNNQHYPAPATPAPLKIKLTVPPSLLAKRLSKRPPETTSAFAAAEYPDLVPKKRGRPPKQLPRHKAPIPKSAAPRKQRSSSSRANLRNPRPPLLKRAFKSRRVAVPTGDSSDDDDDVHMARPYTDDAQFPTFLSASALSSMSSDNSSSLSEFDSDSSIEAEEESFILSDVHNRARTRRELLGGDDPHPKRRNNRNNDWVIRPRKKSVGPSDAEMDLDTDATEEDDQDAAPDEQEDDDETEEDTPMTMASYDDDDTSDHHHHRPYVGLATGWSEDDEESSFDADLFFANLSDSDSSSSDNENDNARGDISESTERGRAARRTLENLPFEVTEAWDGQIVFTNGIHDSLVDLQFEADASRFVVESSASPSRVTRGSADAEEEEEDTDVSMSMSLSHSLSGYESEDLDGECGDGDTTDDELVGFNNPRLFPFAFPPSVSVSAINPLSTVSSPAVSPIRPRRMRWGGESPRAADILQGRVLFWESDDEDEKPAHSSGTGIGRGGGRGRGKTWPMPEVKTPRKGVFVASSEMRQAVIVIDDERKGACVPSPHPRMHVPSALSPARHVRSSTSISIKTEEEDDESPVLISRQPAIGLDDVLDASFLDDTEPSSPPTADIDIDIDIDDPVPASTTCDESTAENQNLSTWDMGMLAVDAWEAASNSNRHHHHLHTPGSSTDFGSVVGMKSPLSALLWQGPAGVTSTSSSPSPSASASSRGGGGKRNPAASVSTGTARPASSFTSMIKGSKLAKRRRITMGGSGMSSPLILPLGSLSASAPTSASASAPGSALGTPSTKHMLIHDDKHHQQQNQTQKNRKELRRERKQKKRSAPGSLHAHAPHAHASHLAHPHHGQQFHTHHHHHPNLKTRSVSSAQRSSGFFGAAGVPPLNL